MNQQFPDPADHGQDAPEGTVSAPVEIIVMAPRTPHKHAWAWTPARMAAVALLAALAGGGLWWWGNDLYWQYQDQMLAEQLAKEARLAQTAQEQQKIQQAWQAHIDHEIQMRHMRLKEAEDAHIAWDNYYKAQAAARTAKN